MLIPSISCNNKVLLIMFVSIECLVFHVLGFFPHSKETQIPFCQRDPVGGCMIKEHAQGNYLLPEMTVWKGHT